MAFIFLTVYVQIIVQWPVVTSWSSPFVVISRVVNIFVVSSCVAVNSSLKGCAKSGFHYPGPICAVASIVTNCPLGRVSHRVAIFVCLWCLSKVKFILCPLIGPESKWSVSTLISQPSINSTYPSPPSPLQGGFLYWTHWSSRIVPAWSFRHKEMFLVVRANSTRVLFQIVHEKSLKNKEFFRRVWQIPFLTKYRILFGFQKSPNIEYYSVLRKSECQIPNTIRYQENLNTKYK